MTCAKRKQKQRHQIFFSNKVMPLLKTYQLKIAFTKLKFLGKVSLKKFLKLSVQQAQIENCLN
jgi:hypothetical protein